MPDPDLRRDRPSSVSRDRLAASVRSEIAELRVRLEETALRSDVYLHTGHPEAAAEVVAEQRDLLEQFRDRVGDAVAAAAVEAEAEYVLSADPTFAELDDHDLSIVEDPAGPSGPATDTPDEEPATSSASTDESEHHRRRRPSRLPAIASAAVTGLAALAFVVASITLPRPQTLAGSRGEDVEVGDAEEADRLAAGPDADETRGDTGGTVGRDLLAMLLAPLPSVDRSALESSAPDPLDELGSLLDRLLAPGLPGPDAGDVPDELERVAGELEGSTDAVPDDTTDELGDAAGDLSPSGGPDGTADGDPSDGDASADGSTEVSGSPSEDPSLAGDGQPTDEGGTDTADGDGDGGGDDRGPDGGAFWRRGASDDVLGGGATAW